PRYRGPAREGVLCYPNNHENEPMPLFPEDEPPLLEPPPPPELPPEEPPLSLMVWSCSCRSLPITARASSLVMSGMATDSASRSLALARYWAESHSMKASTETSAPGGCLSAHSR